MIKEKNLILCIVLSIVTCGIYAIYWAYTLASETVKFNNPEDSGTLEIILNIFFPFIGMYLVEKKFVEACQAKGIEHKDNSIIYLILGIFALSIVSFALHQNELNKIATAE